MKKTEQSHVCQICGATAHAELRPGIIVRPVLGELIRRDHGAWDENGWICTRDLERYRNRYVEELLETEKGEITEIEREVLESLKEQDILSRNPTIDFESHLNLGDRLADRIADFGGSWTFITIFFLVIVCWMAVNSFLIAARPFDPYPYILLNLVLSCLAAIQAPIIMMSQNRQEARDRDRAMHDYQVNLKAELEIRHLHQKLDHLISHQWQRLVEIQEVQMDLMNELRGKK
ncbi:MAG TPA: DUF1003 domain-containing protein [Deltaproteobacteria bacterium]|nr:DUF1003 domain-containing protein [Deltaproteobacteria bacterium]HPR53614.1 DUF1003 domain-containing protein [Deltaproteobacteria bacterium]HXK47129.1 DUF1003 domain-containing protein [Deltaproteobacteria bacterium]